MIPRTVASKDLEMVESRAALVHALAQRLGAQVIETHISWVLVGPELVYKVKKPVRLPFLNYATLSRRRRFCQEEVRVNSAMAPSLYLGVARITGDAGSPGIDGPGPVLDYAVQMRRFAQGALFSERLAAGTLGTQDVDNLAAMLVAVHGRAPRRQAVSAHPSVHQRALGALGGAKPFLSGQQVQQLGAWFTEGALKLAPEWKMRGRTGHVRECHGDLHLDNVVDLDGRATAFDAIDFDPALRWIDVVEDAAFPAMDFAARGRSDYCWRFLNAWLDGTGEHAAAGVLRYALAYRALVRAQVEGMRTAGHAQAAAYVRAAIQWSCPAAPRLVITHGLPGSGKTFRSQQLLERDGAIRVRSDVERKRLFGLGALETSSGRGLDIYTSGATRRTYERLFELASAILEAGFTAVIDAAFLRRGERDAARALASRHGVSFEILACEAPDAVLRERLVARVSDASEADPGVLHRLAASAEPLTPDERLRAELRRG